jgi:hypothetical protein
LTIHAYATNFNTCIRQYRAREGSDAGVALNLRSAEAFKRDNPDAEIRLLYAGRFALESQGPEIAAIIHDLLARKLPKQVRAA